MIKTVSTVSATGGGGGCRVKLRIFEVVSSLLLIVMTTVAQPLNTTDPAEGMIIRTFYSLCNYDL